MLLTIVTELARGEDSSLDYYIRSVYITWAQFRGKKKLTLKKSVVGAEIVQNCHKNHIKYWLFRKRV